MSTIRATYVQHGSSPVPNITLDASGQIIVASGIVSSGTFAAPSGTAAAPGVYFVGDANTGLYSPGADQVAVATNGTGRLFVDATGDTTAHGVVYASAIATPGRYHLKRAEGSYDSPTAITTNSNIGAVVGQGYGGAGYRDVSAIVFASDGAVSDTSSPGYISLYTTAPGAVAVTERARIDSSGRVGIGTTTPRALLHLYGAGQTTANIADSGAREGFLRVSQLGSASGTGGGILFATEQGDNANSVGFAAIKGLLGDGSNNTTGALAFSVRNTPSATSLQEAFRIDSSGRLLVGASTSIPAGSAAASTLQVYQEDNALGATFYSTTNGVGPAGVVVLGHGRTTAAGLLFANDIVGQIRFAGGDGVDLESLAALISAEVDGTPGANDMPGRLVFSTTAVGASIATEAARINSNQQLLVGATAPASGYVDVGMIGAKGFMSRAGKTGAFTANCFNIQWNGSASRLWIDTFDQGSITISSDYRIKKNVKTIDANCIDRIKQLRPVEYEIADYGTLFKADGIVREGFIAHEVQEVIPSGAEGEKDEDNRIQNLRTDAIVAVLTKALQEAISKIETLEAKVAALETP